MKELYQKTLIEEFKDPEEARCGNLPKYNPEYVFTVVLNTMKNGGFPIEVAANLHISTITFQSWLRDPNKQDLRDIFDLGCTYCEAFWTDKGRKGALGDLDAFRESTYKTIMSNKFGWSDKNIEKETTKNKNDLSDEELDARIRALLAKEANESAEDTTG